MKVIAAALLTLLSTSTVTVSDNVFDHGKSGKSRAGMDVKCSPETIQGLWQYTSQTSGTPWNAFIGCTSSGLPEGTTRCQITDQPHWKQDDCVTIGFFDPGYISVNANGYCSFGYNEKGLVVFVKTGECTYSASVEAGNYGVKGQVTPRGILELLFTSDGGDSFYNADNVRLALNAAR